MHIVVNTRSLIAGNLEGFGKFTYESLKRMVAANPSCLFTFLFDRPFDQAFVFHSNVEPLVLSPKTRHPFLYWYWFQRRLPRVLHKLQPDLFLSPDGFLSLSSPVKQLGVIHDLNFVHYPNDLPKSYSKFYNRNFPRFAQKASRIATVSEYSKVDIAKQFSIDEGKIDVVYNGVGGDYGVVDNHTQTEIKNRFSDGSPYVVTLGAMHPRKNLSRLLKAFDQFKAAANSEVKLVMIGKRWWSSEMEQTYNNLRFKEDVVFTGYLPTKEVKEVLGSAIALLYVSYFEGFGIPLLEAMACEVPVVAANATSLPEVAGQAAHFVDPFSIDSIASGIQEIIVNQELRKDLVANGLERVKMFSWENTSDRLWESVLKTIDAKRIL